MVAAKQHGDIMRCAGVIGSYAGYTRAKMRSLWRTHIGACCTPLGLLKFCNVDVLAAQHYDAALCIALDRAAVDDEPDFTIRTDDAKLVAEALCVGAQDRRCLGLDADPIIGMYAAYEAAFLHRSFVQTVEAQ